MAGWLALLLMDTAAAAKPDKQMASALALVKSGQAREALDILGKVDVYKLQVPRFAVQHQQYYILRGLAWLQLDQAQETGADLEHSLELGSCGPFLSTLDAVGDEMADLPEVWTLRVACHGVVRPDEREAVLARALEKHPDHLGLKLMRDGERPEPTEKTDPEWPAKIDAESGKVVLLVSIDTKGRVRDTKVIDSTAAGFEAAAEKAVSKWTFDPVMVDERAVAVRFDQLVTFTK
ncbi:MAG: energy transducer TonB [Myxococcota bacterium]